MSIGRVQRFWKNDSAGFKVVRILHSEYTHTQARVAPCLVSFPFRQFKGPWHGEMDAITQIFGMMNEFQIPLNW